MIKIASHGQLDLWHPRFIGAGSTLLMAAFVTDAIYCQTSLMQWANFSAWLIAAGLVLALVAAIVVAVERLTGRAGHISWTPFAILTVAALLSLLNVFVHARDAWTSVVPQGIALSAIVTLLLLVSACLGWRVTTAQPAATGKRT